MLPLEERGEGLRRSIFRNGEEGRSRSVLLAQFLLVLFSHIKNKKMRWREQDVRWAIPRSDIQ